MNEILKENNHLLMRKRHILIDILFQNELSSLRNQKTSSNSFIPEKVTHVGMYIGDNKFIHASSGGKKVIISDLTTGYYKTRYLFSKRYL